MRLVSGIEVAERYLGLNEISDFKVLNGFLSENGFNVDVRTTPWCAYFVNSCEKQVGRNGTNKGLARSFETYGTPVKLSEAREGDIVVLSRGNTNWQGHVTYLHKINKETITCLGGNQGDGVNCSNYKISSIVCIRRST